MITRVWHGWTSIASAGRYEALLRSEVLPGIEERVPGYLGASVLRRDRGHEIEFVTLTYFDSMDAVGAFAGPDREAAVVPGAAREILTRFDARAAHYETLVPPPRLIARP